MHYTCLPCQDRERAAFKRQLARLRAGYPRVPSFPTELIADMDAEVRREAKAAEGRLPPT